MPEDPKPPPRRKSSTQIVGPFSRIRVIVALICFAIAAGVLAWRAFTG